MTPPSKPTHPDVVALLGEARRYLPSDHTVVRFDASKLDVIVDDGRDRTLIFREKVLLEELRDGSGDGQWGLEVLPIESVARLMTVTWMRHWAPVMVVRPSAGITPVGGSTPSRETGS